MRAILISFQYIVLKNVRIRRLKPKGRHDYNLQSMNDSESLSDTILIHIAQIFHLRRFKKGMIALYERF